MPAKNVVPRGARIPLPPRHWWPTAAREAAERRADDLGIRRPGTRSLVEALADEGVKVDEDTVARCLKGTIVTWDVAIPLSRILKIPAPASIAATPDDARAMESTDELRTIMKAIDKIRRDEERLSDRRQRMSRMHSDDSGEWSAWFDVIRGDAEAYVEARKAMRELAARVALRVSGDRMARGRLFGVRNASASA